MAAPAAFSPPPLPPPPVAPPTDALRLAAWLVSTAVIIGGLYLGQDVLMPLAIAFLISFALNPMVRWLVRHGVPRALAVTLVMAAVFLLFAGLALLIASQLAVLSAELPTYQSTIRAKIDDLVMRMSGPGVLDGVFQTFDAVRQEIGQAMASRPANPPPMPVEIVSDDISALGTAAAWLAPAIAPLATTGIVLVFVFLALLDRGDLRDRLLRMLGGNLHQSTDAIEEAGRRISRYLLMQLVVNAGYAVPMTLGLWLIGVPGYVLWGTLAGLMRFVPYVGPILSAVFPLALAFAVDPGWNMLLLTGALILVLELASANIVEPILYGTSTGLSALSLIAAATFWTALWGPVGLILSTPLTVCLLVIGRYLPQLQFLDTLLGSTPALDVATRIYQRLIADDPEEAVEIATEAIEQSSVVEFHDRHGLAVLRQASSDFSGAARPEHRLRVVSGMDVLLDELRAEFPPPEAAGAPRVAMIGGKWEIDNVAGEMLAHALETAGIAVLQRQAGVLSRHYMDRLRLEGIEVACVSFVSPTPERSARAFCRRFRQRWPGVRIVLGLWNMAPAGAGEGDAADRAREWGADHVVTSIAEAVQRVGQIVAPEGADPRHQPGPPPDEPERIEALHRSGVLDGRARDELDSLAARAAEVFDVGLAVITAIDTAREVILGQSRDLPGEPTLPGSDTVALPRAEAISAPLLASGSRLVVPDTRRDPRLADHPVIARWNARFLAAVPIRDPQGHVLGALCLLDDAPHELGARDLELLDAIAADVTRVILGDEPASRRRDDRAEPARGPSASPA